MKSRIQRSAVHIGMESIIQTSHDGVIFISADCGTIIYANTAAEKLMGYSSEEMLGCQFTMLLPSHAESQLTAIKNSAGIPGRHSYIGLRKDGRQIPLECSSSPFRAGSTEFLSLTVRDAGECFADTGGSDRNEARYQVIFESTQDAVFLVRKECFVDCNASTLRLFGCRRNQIIGQSPARFSPAMQPDGRDSSQRARELMDAALGGSSQCFEWRHCRYDGTVFDAEVSLDRFEEDGQAMLLARVRDITERKRVEEALRNREEQLLMFVKHAPAAIAMFDTDMRYLAVSDRFLTDYRLDRKNLVGLCHYDVFPEFRTMEERRAIHNRCLAGAIERCEEDPFLRSDGALDWVKWEIVPWRKPAGSIGGIVFFSEVITAQKKAQEALRLKNEELDRFFSVTLDLLCIAGMDGRFRRLNAAWPRTLGYSREELSSRQFLELVHPDDLSRTLEAMTGLAAGREVICFVNRFRHKGGAYRWLEWRAAFAGDLMYAAARDVTERIEAEEQLKRFNLTLEHRIIDRTAQLRILAERLSETEHRERKRIAHILHEHFQQLLVAATMQLGMLRSRLKDQQSINIIAAVDQILAEAVEASRSLAIELSPPILQCLGLVPTLDWLARRTRDKYGLQVVVSADQSAEPASDDLKTFLFEIVSELLFNVVKHAKADSASVRMTLGANDQISLVVSDRGTGFDTERLKDLQPTGGLGLFSIRERVDWLGGALRIDSTPGQGTSVSIRVPSNPEKHTPPLG